MKNDSKIPLQNLTISLAKEGYDTPEEVLNPRALRDYYTIGAESSPIGKLHIIPGWPKSPKWSSFFTEHIDINRFGNSSSPGAVLLITINGRIFAVTFGTGRFYLKPDCWEERFGLRVALNCIGEDKVRGIDKRSFDAISRHTREQASRETSTRAFGLDIEQDLLRAVTGTPKDISHGIRIHGMDALTVTIRIKIEDLPAILAVYFEKFLDTSYRKNFPWVDHISEVRNHSLQNELDSQLIERLAVDDFDDRVWMAVPEVVAWERVSGFRFSFRSRSPEYHDIHLPFFLESLSDPTALTKEMLLSKHVNCVDSDGQIIYKWRVYNCIYCEQDYNGESFLLSGGKWYRLAKDFVKKVDDAYKSIPRYKFEFPEYDDKSETEYNKRIAGVDTSMFALMDCKNISYGGGNNKVEFCDLYTSNKNIIHVKRFGSSSVLSHLFAQGLVSGEIFQTEQNFREAVNEKLPVTHQLDDSEQRPEYREYHVVFAVISDSPDELVLPFFSRLNLKHAVRRLEGYGFRVSLAKIPVSDYLSKKKKYK